MNILHCGNGTYDAVLGYVALEKDVCYPAHRHWADEAYWQVAGGGFWRTWEWIKEATYVLQDEVDLKGAPNELHINSREHPHELDTSNDIDHGNDVMLLLYWWGKQKFHPENYEWASEIQNDINITQFCGTSDRIPRLSDKGPIHC